MRIGIDVDGIIADFNGAFIDRVIALTDRDLFPARPFDIPIWDYPQHYGYTGDEVSAVWQNIKQDRNFWANLDPYKWTSDFLSRLDPETDDLYFITNRMGVSPKQQTERWLWRNQGPLSPTVLITAMKGWTARSLDLDVYIDDRDLNVIDVRTVAPKTRTFILDQPWNRVASLSEFKGIERITNPLEMLKAIGR